MERAAQTILLAIALMMPLLAAGAGESFFSLNMGDLQSEAADAKREGKKALLLVFEQEGCPYCRAMRENIMSRKDVQTYYRGNFVALPVDIWSSVPIRDFANREQTEKSYSQSIKIKGTPTFVFYDLNGNEISRVFGVVETPEEFLLLGRYISSGAYKTRDFAQFKSQNLAKKGT